MLTVSSMNEVIAFGIQIKGPAIKLKKIKQVTAVVRSRKWPVPIKVVNDTAGSRLGKR